MVDYAVYLFYRIGTGLFGLLPLPLAFAIGQMAGVIAWLVLPQYRKLALRNVRIAFAGELRKNRCGGSCVDIFSSWALTCFAA